MPADQQGQVYKTSGGFGLRWYDEQGDSDAARRASRRGRRPGPWFRDVELLRMRWGLVNEPLTARIRRAIRCPVPRRSCARHRQGA